MIRARQALLAALVLLAGFALLLQATTQSMRLEFE